MKKTPFDNMIQKEDLKVGACFIWKRRHYSSVVQLYYADEHGWNLRGFNSEGKYERLCLPTYDPDFSLYCEALTQVDPKAYDKLKKLNDVYKGSVASIFNEFS